MKHAEEMLARTLLFAIGTALMTTAAPATAKRAPIVVTGPPDEAIASVSYADLNVATKTDQQRLYRRVGATVVSMCDEAIDGDRLVNAAQAVDQACRDRSWVQALPQLKTAIERAYEVAATGTSTIPTAAIGTRATK
jgi:UrcA family protein